MKLQHYSLENCVDFALSPIWTLVCENTQQFCELTGDMYRQTHQGEGKWGLFDGKQLDISKRLCYISDYHSLSFADKKASNLLQDKLQALAFSEDYTIATHEILSQLTRFAQRLAEDLDFPTSVKDPDVATLLKMVGVSLLDESNNLCEKLVDYVTLLSRLTVTNVVVCVNLRSYLSDTEQEQLFAHCMQCDINLLCIESFYRQRLQGECILVSDADLCEFYPNA